jgi:hypothetical protein
MLPILIGTTLVHHAGAARWLDLVPGGVVGSLIGSRTGTRVTSGARATEPENRLRKARLWPSRIVCPASEIKFAAANATGRMSFWQSQ